MTVEQQPIVQIQNVSKYFGSACAVDDISLDIYPGEFFSLLGPSGCGKTTLLRMLAGFEKPTEGRIFIDGEDVTDLPPYLRPINMMFQSYALFPHMTVAENIAYGLKQEKMPAALIKERVEEMLKLVQISQFAKRKPHQLSGGQRQRVALARALAKHPKILLLDEPLGALDKKLREQTQFELVNLQERLGITFIVVTHDQEEAMTMSSRIALIKDGRAIQVDAPRRMYEYPNCRYSADFIGTINLIDAHVIQHADDGTVSLETNLFPQEIEVIHGQPLIPDMNVTVAIRPEKIQCVQQTDPVNANQVSGIIKEIAYLGDVSIYHVELDSGYRMQFTQSNTLALAEQPLQWEERVVLQWQSNACTLLLE